MGTLLGTLTLHHGQCKKQHPCGKAQRYQDVEDGHRRHPAALSPATSGVRVTCGEQYERNRGGIPVSEVWIWLRPPMWVSSISQEQLTFLGRIWRCRFPRKDVNPYWEEGRSHWVMFWGAFYGQILLRGIPQAHRRCGERRWVLPVPPLLLWLCRSSSVTGVLWPRSISDRDTSS